MSRTVEPSSDAAAQPDLAARPGAEAGSSASALTSTHSGLGAGISGLQRALATPGFAAKVQATISWWNQTRLARTLARYGTCTGGLLSGGMALTTLLSLTAALTVGWTVFMAVLGDNQELRDRVIDALNQALPGLLKSGADSSGLVDPDSLVRSDAWSFTGIIALVVAAWSVISVVGSLARSIRSMFGVVSLPENGMLTIGRNVVGALGLAVSLVAGAGLGILTGLFGDWTMQHLGISPGVGRILLTIATHLLAMMVNAVVLALLIRVVAGVRVPRPDLVGGLVLFAVIAEVLQYVGTTAVGAVDSPILATATTLVTLVLWVNLLVRVVLTVCAWMSNPPRSVPLTQGATLHFRECPNFVTLSAPETLAWPHHPVTGELMPAATDESSGVVDVTIPSTSAQAPALGQETHRRDHQMRMVAAAAGTSALVGFFLGRRHT